MSKLDRDKVRGMSNADISKLRTNAIANPHMKGAAEVVAWCDDELNLRNPKSTRVSKSRISCDNSAPSNLQNLPSSVRGLACQLWSYVNLGSSFPWPRSANSRANLCDSISAIIGEENGCVDGARELRNISDNHTFNVKLRSFISPHLLKDANDKSDEISAWIVRNWGGIRAGNNDAFPAWVAAIRDDGIPNFVARMGTERISSWSKILAFADPENHAIYDARTAVALNCGLASLGYGERFFMPLSQNKGVAAARLLLVADQGTPYMGYDAYIALLKEISLGCGGMSILEVEMALFANAPEIAENFRHNQQEKEKCPSTPNSAASNAR